MDVVKKSLKKVYEIPRIERFEIDRQISVSMMSPGEDFPPHDPPL
ncbi:hypothetical protein ACFLSA_05945 [Bacteroidota bacterium]